LHWADVVASKLMQRGPRHVICSGTSISGRPHIGSAGDVIFADVIARAVRRAGGEAEVVWIQDDMDPLRSVPDQIPKEFEAHLGKPVCDLPPVGGVPFVEHFVRPFLAGLAALGIRPRVVSGAGLYRGGLATDLVRIALDRADDVRRILTQFSGSEKAEDWLPFSVVCQQCGRIATTKAYGRDAEGRVLYRCAGGVAGKKGIEGCGHEGAAALTEGKLAWRLDWAARWKLLGVTCEPFGKDHAAAGGSWDTSSVIIEEVFGYPKPLPVVYEHILVGGEKMSKSKGNVVALEELLEVVPPEVVRYLFVRTDPNKHKDFDWAKLPQLVEEYERVERIHYGLEAPSPREDVEELRRTYELSQVSPAPLPSARPHQVPFSHLVTIVQIAPDLEGVMAVLGRTGELPPDLDAASRAVLAAKADRARAWVATRAPEDARFSLAPSLPAEASSMLTDAQRAFLAPVADALARGPWTADAIHNTVHEHGKAAGLKAGDAFGAVYIALLGKRRGPRLGYFLASIDRAWALARLAEAATAINK